MLERQLRSISLFELEILSLLRDFKTLRTLARSLEVEISYLSKVIQRLEHDLSTEIIKTSPQGYVLTSEGQNIVKCARALTESAGELLQGKSSGPDYDFLTIGSRGFLNIFFCGSMLEALQKSKSDHRFRFLDMSPDEIRTTAIGGVTDIAIHLEKIDWPNTWDSMLIGNFQWKFFCRHKHPLAKKITSQELLKYPLVSSCHWNGSAIANSPDRLSIPKKLRLRGHEMQTALTAIEIIRNTDQLALIPTVIAADAASSGQIRSIEITDLEISEQPVYLSVRNEKVSQKLYKELQLVLTKRLLHSQSSR